MFDATIAPAYASISRLQREARDLLTAPLTPTPHCSRLVREQYRRKDVHLGKASRHGAQTERANRYLLYGMYLYLDGRHGGCAEEDVREQSQLRDGRAAEGRAQG